MKNKNTQTIPSLRFSEFNAPWKSTKLGELLTFKNGVNADKAQYGTGTKFVNVLDVMSKSPIVYDTIVGSVEVSADELGKNTVEFGDLLFQRSSETRQDVGVANVYVDKKKVATFGGFVIRGKAIDGVEYVPKYLWHLLKTEKARAETTRLSGGSTRYNIGQKSLESVPIWLSSDLKEQEKIASFLGRVDEKIELLNEKQNLLKQYKDGVMQQIFAQDIRFKDDNGNDFPDWESVELGQLCRVISGLTYSPRNIASKGLLVLRSSNIKDSSIKLDDCVFVDLEVSTDAHAVAGDILLCVRNGSRRLIGKSALIPNGMLQATHGAFMSLLRGEENGFLFQLMQTELYRRQVFVNLGATINSINSTALKRFRFFIPGSRPEREKIAAFLSAIDEKINFVAQQITHMQDFKKGLLQQMFV